MAARRIRPRGSARDRDKVQIEIFDAPILSLALEAPEIVRAKTVVECSRQCCPVDSRIPGPLAASRLQIAISLTDVNYEPVPSVRRASLPQTHGRPTAQTLRNLDWENCRKSA